MGEWRGWCREQEKVSEITVNSAVRDGVDDIN